MFGIHVKNPTITSLLSQTLSLRAFLLKKALHDSQEMASKLQPNALSPHTPHILSSTFFIFLRASPPFSPPSSLPSCGEFCQTQQTYINHSYQPFMDLNVSKQYSITREGQSDILRGGGVLYFTKGALKFFLVLNSLKWVFCTECYFSITVSLTTSSLW